MDLHWPLSGGGLSFSSRAQSPETQNMDFTQGWVLWREVVKEVGAGNLRLEVSTGQMKEKGDGEGIPERR